MTRTWTVKDLEEWDATIREVVEDIKLDCYPQEFEVCDHEQMLGLMAYSGMPSHYPHWSFGKSFEQQKTMYDHGVSGLPYEMVINSNPCLGYLMRDNSLCLQVLTIAHVYGHNDFFKNNFTFGFTQAGRVVEQFKAHAQRVRTYVEDPSIGRSGVERIVDAAHALAYQCARNPALRKLDREEQIERTIRRAAPKQDDQFRNVHRRPDYVMPDLARDPLEPEEDLLLFIRDHNPRLADWQRDVLTIVHDRMRYFLPQIETKIMNEGWACYVHRYIMNRLDLPQDIRMEFLVRHNQVVRPIEGQINPYHLGLAIWDDISTRGDANLEPAKIPPSDTMFQIREADRDTSFLRRFLTPELMRRLDLFEFRSGGGGDVTVSRTSDEENWRQVKETLIRNTGMNSIPVIKIVDSDYRANRHLLMRHEYDGRELQLEYAERTLRYVYDLWGRPVHLETKLDGTNRLLGFDGDSFSVRTALD